MRPIRRKLCAGLLALTAASPASATFSICALDPDTGELGVAVTTRVPFVGRAVPWVRAGVGAVATQAWTVVEYGRNGLDLLEQGIEPEAVLEALLAGDAGRERRQLGILDARGRAAAHTGAENGDWAGSRQGPNYTVQGNILVGAEVVEAVASHFESTEGVGMPLAERMLLALSEGQKKGGDRRWGELQSAAIRIADLRDPGRGGDHLSLSIDVGEHPEPVGEMLRIYRTTARRLGWRSFSLVRGDDVVELKRILHALGYWRTELEAFPDPPRFKADPARMRTDPEGYAAEIEAFRKRAADYSAAFAAYDAEAVTAVDAFRKDRGLDFQGTPPGLVDTRLVDALRDAYYSRSEGAAAP
jgi:uncharacterized Ntn-hydrolase superfamily protein